MREGSGEALLLRQGEGDGGAIFGFIARDIAIPDAALKCEVLAEDQP